MLSNFCHILCLIIIQINDSVQAYFFICICNRSFWRHVIEFIPIRSCVRKCNIMSVTKIIAVFNIRNNSWQTLMVVINDNKLCNVVQGMLVSCIYILGLPIIRISKNACVDNKVRSIRDNTANAFFTIIARSFFSCNIIIYGLLCIV